MKPDDEQDSVLMYFVSHRDDLKSVLVRVASGLNVVKLLEGLNTTTDFEVEMSRKMGMSVSLHSTIVLRFTV